VNFLWFTIFIPNKASWEAMDKNVILGDFMKKLIEEMQKKIKEGKIRFQGVIDIEEDEKVKGKLKKSIAIKDTK